MDKSWSSFLKYGFEKEPKVRRFIYSMIVILLYFFGVGIPFVLGYMLKITRRISDGENLVHPPNFRPVRPLIKDGFVVGFYITILLAVPSIGVALIDYIVSSYVGLGSLNPTETALINGVAAGLFVAFVCGTYLLPVTICAVAVNKTWDTGVDFKSMGRIIYTRGYLKMYLKFMSVSMLIGLLAWIAVTLVLTIPLALVIWFIYITTISQIFGYYAAGINQKDLGD